MRRSHPRGLRSAHKIQAPQGFRRAPQRFQDEAAALRLFAEAIEKVPQAPGLRPALSGGFVSDMLQLVKKP